MSSERSVARLAFLLIGVAVFIVVSCSERSTKPVDTSEPVIHELWPDEEAELMALAISGKTSAPRQLYDQVHSELAFIRQRWGDSIPIVRKLTYAPHFVAGRIEMGVDNDTYVSMQAGKYTAWDSLNQYYNLQSLRFYQWSNAVLVQMATRINPKALISSYRTLPGVRWIETGSAQLGDRPRVYASLDSAGISYLFRDAWGDCPAGCIFSHYWCFKSDRGTVTFQGEYEPSWDSVVPKPTWWAQASKGIDRYYDYTDLFWQRRDSIAPAAITDLLAGNPTSNSVTLSWTAPFDGGSSGPATGYDLRYATFAITDSSWSRACGTHSLPIPGPPGAPQHFTLQNLKSNASYYFAIKSGDFAGNWSAISNPANAMTLASPGWTTYGASSSQLVSCRFTTLCVEPSGTIWCGTEDGLSRFDGTNWMTFTSANSSLPYKWITAAVCDRTGTCWFGTSSGVARFREGVWSRVPSDSNGLASNQVFSMATDSAGGVWFGHGNGLVSRLLGDVWSHYQVYNDPRGLIFIWSITCDKDGEVWAATDVGAFKFDGANWTAFTPSNSGIASTNVRVLSADRYGSWFTYPGSWKPISLYSDGVWKTYTADYSEFPYGRVAGAAISRDGVAWFATPSGAVHFNGTGWDLLHAGNSGLVSNNVRAVAFASSGVMWLGTSAGLSRYDADTTRLLSENERQ